MERALFLRNTRTVYRSVRKMPNPLKPEMRYPANITLDLGTARTDVEYDVGGKGITLVMATGQVYIRLNEPDNPLIDFNTSWNMIGPFYRFFITNTAQAGLVGTILISTDFIQQNGIIPVSNTILGLPGTLQQVGITPYVYNVVCTVADTEYSQVLPAATKMLSVHMRDDGAGYRLAWVTGKVATPTAPYINILTGGYYSETALLLGATPTLYFATSSAGKYIEIIAWV
jgi:hypothetical protein